MLKNLFPLIISITIAQAAGIIGSVFTVTGVRGWYAGLAKPAWNPPSWVFGPVWITLYTLMGVAAYLVWRKKGGPQVKLALIFYLVQLLLNSFWSILFFGLRNPGVALAEIILLTVTLVVTLVMFWKINSLAGILLLPYLFWVMFAAYLNYTIWSLN